MKIHYPRSFLRLLLLGFALAMLPLLLAFANASLYLDRLAEQSRNTVAQAVQATRASRLLVEQLNQMERSARQYFVLHDRSLLDHYQESRDKFLAAGQELEALPLDQQQRTTLAALRKLESTMQQRIRVPHQEGEPDPAIIADFVSMADHAQRILQGNSLLTDRAAARLAETAAETQRMMLWQSLTLLPVAILVALTITFLVAQPIRRMDAAIRRLGEGQYHQPISIDGPGDLRTLGERLDWLREQLQSLEAQKQRFLRHVSHELKTPLTAIREGSELLSEEVAGSLTPQQREIAEILRDNSLRLQRMIESLLRFTAVQFHKPQMQFSPVNLAQLVADILPDYALTLQHKHITVQHPAASAAHVLEGDAEQLRSALDNLLSNAIKFTPAEGTVEVRIQQQDEQMCIDVIDSGPGVTEADRPHLFDPFYRGKGPEQTIISGTGLGLSIAKEYVTAHGGSIGLLDSAHGAHFQITLPLKASLS
ncbi:HAMP domain-containing protein [Pseudomethylobacillus aquaticus]|uniref:histidine kinase n=1 Tax=Pseudomethylobacillus aquaticus TaxID=2676064 RepID=A0A3N0UXN4_9PROT|nr:ATP-binding protein [Pseudomethylobacillus aquaticus]ROH85306.1 HAMP domain-containing protein [Pseudomethylobacillus aquaticus]